MSKPRKTVILQNLVALFNERILATDSQETRSALCSMIEEILHSHGAYHGFNYHDWLEGGCEAWEKECARLGAKVDNTPYLGDKTKHRYYT